MFLPLQNSKRKWKHSYFNQSWGKFGSRINLGSCMAYLHPPLDEHLYVSLTTQETDVIRGVLLDFIFLMYGMLTISLYYMLYIIILHIVVLCMGVLLMATMRSLLNSSSLKFPSLDSRHLRMTVLFFLSPLYVLLLCLFLALCAG